MSEPIYNPHETETSIELGPGNLMRQAVMTAHDYMMYARSNINELFGNGYAEKHPELIGRKNYR